MSESHDNEILKLGAKIEAYDQIEKLLGDNIRNIKSTSAVKNAYLIACNDISDQIRKITSAAKRSAILADSPSAAVGIMCDAFDTIDVTILNYERSCTKNADLDAASLNVIGPIISYLSDSSAGASQKILAFERMIVNPAAAEEVKVRRTMGDHPEKIRNKRAFNDINQNDDQDPIDEVLGDLGE